MIVGIIELELYIYEVYSLKEKRSIIKSLVDKLKNKYNISIAEVGDNDTWNKALIGICLVGNTSNYVNKVISRVIGFIDRETRVEIIYENIEIM